MQLGLAYSLRMLIENKLGIPAVIVYDGIRLPSDKPFAAIHQMNNVSTSISKARESVEINYGFRVSFHCESLAQRSTMQEGFRDAILFDRIPLYNSLGEITDGSVEVEIDGEVPLNASDIADESNHHQIHFELSVIRVRHRNRK